jgi:uncharacterized membrane protein
VPSRVRTKLTDVAASLDDLAPRLALAGRTWLPWPVLYAITTGSALWAVRHVTQLATYDGNKLSLPDTLWMLASVVGTLLTILLGYFIACAVMRRRHGEWRTVETISALNRRLRPLLALPILPALLVPNVERDWTKQTFFYIAIFGALTAFGAYAWARAPGVEPLAVEGQPDAPAPRRPWRENLYGFLATAAVAALWAGYGYFFSRLAIINHHALNSRTIDLGYYDNIFYQSAHGRPLACSMIKAGYHGSAHFDPILVVLSPLYYLYPRAEFLLVLQSVWLGAGVVPVYLIAKHKLGRRLPAVALAAMFALFPALHGANMYEFHSLSLLSSILLWLLYFLETGNFRGYYLTLIPALLCREDVSLILCFVGAYSILSGRARAVRSGWVTIFVSLVYFAIVKRFFMTSADIFMSGKDSYSYAYYYEDLIPNKNGVAGLVLSVVTNPVFVVKTIFAEPKVVYLLTLFLPLAFIPFFAKTSRVMLVYGLLFCTLATRTAVFSPAFQYSATLIPFAFALTPIALRQIEDGRLTVASSLDGARLSRALLAGAFAASVLVSWKFGGFIDNQFFHGGFVRVTRSLTPAQEQQYAWLDATVAKIPKGASVGVTNETGCHVSNRKDVYFYPGSTPTDYVLLDENELHGADLDKHTKAVQTGELVQIARHDKMALFRVEKKAAAPAAAASATATAAAATKPAPTAPPTDAGADAALAADAGSPPDAGIAPPRDAGAFGRFAPHR